MTRISSSLIPLTLAIMWATASVHAAPTLALLPSGTIYGNPGDIVGWGFTITNNTDYIEITSSQFCLSPVSFPITCNPPTIGTFTDYISQFNDIIVGPADGAVTSTVTQPFSTTALTGVGAFQINLSAVPGSSNVGQIVLTYNVYDADPLLGPFDTIASDQVLAADASVVVGPEPATPVLSGIALLLLVVFMRARLRGRHTPGESLLTAG